MSAVLPVKGLEGIIATKSSICWIDGEAGVLAYRGIDIHELAEHSDFEETTYLLWFGRLPTAAELAQFTKELAAARTLNWRIYDFLRMVPHDATPMEVLRTAVSLLSLYDPDEKDSGARGQRAQGLPHYVADRDDRGDLRPHPQGPVDHRS